MSGRRAFTLVEMIVALAITSVLTVMMLRMFTDSSTIWKREDERLDTFREARAALQLMASELSTVNPMPDVNPNAATGGAEQFPVLALQYHQDTPGDDQTVPGNQEIYALANLPYRPTIDPDTKAIRDRSEVRAIGYFCEWREEKTELNQTKNSYVLRRQGATSDATFTRLQTALKATGPQYPASFYTLYSRDQVDPNPATAVPPVQDIASYVWDLQFILAPPAPTATNPTPVSAPWPQGIFARELPQWVEIRFKALGSASARKLAGQNLNRANWLQTKDATYQRLILPGEQQFVTRVKLSR